MISLCARSLFLVNLAFIVYIWSSTLIFVIKKKKEKLLEQDEKLSKAIPLFFFLMTEAFLYHEVTSIVLGALFMYNDGTNFDHLSDYFKAELFLVDPLVNFSICCSLCYLLNKQQ